MTTNSGLHIQGLNNNTNFVQFGKELLYDGIYTVYYARNTILNRDFSRLKFYVSGYDSDNDVIRLCSTGVKAIISIAYDDIAYLLVAHTIKEYQLPILNQD